MRKLRPPLLIGDKRNRLQVLNIRTYQKTFKTGSIRKLKEVFIKCDCGRTKWIRYEHVSGGLVKSCGCLNYEPQCKDPKQRAVNRTLAYIKHSAKVRKLSFNLTGEILKSIIFNPCFYCGRNPYRIICAKDRPYGIPTEACNGLDRINSNKGYELGNIVSCCFTCNMMKFELTVEEFIKHIELLATRANIIRTNLNENTNT